MDDRGVKELLRICNMIRSNKIVCILVKSDSVFQT